MAQIVEIIPCQILGPARLFYIFNTMPADDPDARSQGISSHGVDYVSQTILILVSEGFNSEFSTR